IGRGGHGGGLGEGDVTFRRRSAGQAERPVADDLLLDLVGAPAMRADGASRTAAASRSPSGSSGSRASAAGPTISETTPRSAGGRMRRLGEPFGPVDLGEAAARGGRRRCRGRGPTRRVRRGRPGGRGRRRRPVTMAARPVHGSFVRPAFPTGG